MPRFSLPWLIATVSVLLGSAFSQGGPQVHEPAPNLRPSCTPPTYQPVPQPDIIANLLSERKRYRLVIGVGQFKYDPTTNNRSYVEPTAVLVDARLDELGYEPLPGVSQSGKPYLVGPAATRSAITAALQEMARVTQGQDFGIIYFVGHGNIPPSGVDLTLGIYDEPVAPDQGYRVTDIFGILQTSNYLTSIAQIPHLFVILDTCFSGTVAQPSRVAVVNTGGVQHLAEIPGGGPVIPDQVAILTATAAGSDSSAYELQGTGLSAFGYYFARALKDDWPCSDSLARDGIVTLQEMKEYLTKRLKLASDKGAVLKPMSPSMLARDQDALLAYRADKYVEPGFRDLIYSLLIQPSADQIVDITVPGALQASCSDATNGCAVPISKTFADSNLTVAVRAPHGGYKAETGEEVTSEPSRQTVKLSDLINRLKTVLGVKLQVNQSTIGCNSPAVSGVTGDVNINIQAPCGQSPVTNSDNHK